MKIRWQIIRQVDLTDEKKFVDTYPLEAALARKTKNRSYLHRARYSRNHFNAYLLGRQLYQGFQQMA